MTSSIRNQLFHKAISMEIIKNQVQLSLTKSEVQAIIHEAMQDESAGASIKRILNPFLANAFPQFPEHTQVSLGTTDESGATVVTLRKPIVRAVNEPEELEEPEEL